MNSINSYGWVVEYLMIIFFIYVLCVFSKFFILNMYYWVLQ